ncbi:MAG: DivIVA domain-containing protein [bacterium]|nr:DivIVA domain-containing protein [bacterium]
MEITPQDVQQKQFDQVKRGFDPQQVGMYLDQTAAALAARDRELHEAHTEIAALGRAVEDVKQNEEAFRLTMTAATQAKEEMLRRAGETADKLEADARDAASLIVERARVEADDQVAVLKRDIESLQGERTRLEAQLVELREHRPVAPEEIQQGDADRPALELVVDQPHGPIAPDESALAARVGDLRG